MRKPRVKDHMYRVNLHNVNKKIRENGDNLTIDQFVDRYTVKKVTDHMAVARMIDVDGKEVEIKFRWDGSRPKLQHSKEKAVLDFFSRMISYKRMLHRNIKALHKAMVIASGLVEIEEDKDFIHAAIECLTDMVNVESRYEAEGMV